VRKLDSPANWTILWVPETEFRPAALAFGTYGYRFNAANWVSGTHKNMIARVKRRSWLLAPLARWAKPLFPAGKSAIAVREYRKFLSSWRAYSQLPDAEPLRFEDSYPCLFDSTATTPYDAHYFHQAVWAAERIVARAPEEHVDVGSDIYFAGILSVSVPVAFVDIRPLNVVLPRLHPLAGDLLDGLPFGDGSIDSLSCLHVAEHIGLGRYGDELAPDGTRRACIELQRVLAPNGRLYFSLPVGRPRVCFNAHRIHAPRQILAYFADLELEEFSLVGDDARLVYDADLDAAGSLDYGCGLFVFRRPMV
jgi:Caenorhabditis protein of unknown function, DUF268